MKSVIGIVVALLILGATCAAWAQSKGKRSTDPSVRLQETEITGKLQDIVGTFKLLETEIVGTLEKPKVNYIIPWRQPEAFLLEETDFRRGFLNEIYTPIDRDFYSQEIEIRVR